jgi:hypothetical protein
MIALCYSNARPVHTFGTRLSAYYRGNLETGQGAITAPVTGQLTAVRYHPLGVEQDRTGLDELGRIPSEQKEKQTLWLT